MVLPILIGVGVTVLALTAKSTILAASKYRHLTPAMIASLNNLKAATPDTRLDPNHPHYNDINNIRNKYLNQGFNNKMNEREALLIMGIDSDEIMNLNKSVIKDRYRKLMVMNHPDKNGSQYLTQKINEAKDILDKSYLFKDEK